MAATQTLPLSPSVSQISKHGVLTLYGFGIGVSMQSGHLAMEHGTGPDRRNFRLPRVGHGLRRLVVIGNDGLVSLAALRWLSDQDCAFVMLNRDGKVLITTGPVHRSDARLRRAQALAHHSGAALEIARELISKKLAGQERVARNKLLDSSTADAIAVSRAEVDRAETLDAIRLLEAQGAVQYWAAWNRLPICWPKNEIQRVPDHWLTFGTRRSPISGSQRLACNPPNAILNYLYALLETEARLAAAAVGLDPGLGVIHMDAPVRDSLACDLMEPVRPIVDAWVVDLITRQPLNRRWFFEKSDGNCRLMSEFTAQLSQTSASWARAVAPYAEWVVHVLSRSRTSKAKPRSMRTPLTQKRRTEGRGLVYHTASIVIPSPSKVCERCGCDGVARRFCSACAKVVSGETMANVAQLARQIKRTPKVKAKVSKLLSEHAVANTWWNPEDMPAWLTDEYYAEQIWPRLKGIKVREIASAIKVSHAYAALVRAGKRRPHPRHWQLLANLVKSEETD